MTGVHEVIITAADTNRRLDKFLFMYLNNAPHSFIYKLLRKKRIKLNQKRAQGGELLQAGDMIKFHISQEALDSCRKNREGINPGASSQARYKMPKIVYEDGNLLIINKPPGMASHGGMKNKNPHLLARVLVYLQEKGSYTAGANFVPALCNRLDVNTSGLVICGKNYQAIRAMNALFASPGAIKKEYLAIAEGELTGSAVLEGQYHKDTNTNTVRISQGTAPPRAVTGYTSLAVSKGRTLLSVNPITGRSHQIRAHLTAIGHPLAGDKKYGGSPVHDHDAPGQLLHCKRIRITKPFLDYPINTTWVAEPPEYFKHLAQEWFGYDE